MIQKMKNGDKPAIGGAWPFLKDMNKHQTNNGLTKREHFAAMAMQSVLGKYNPYEYGDFDSSNYEETARNAVGLADALLKELAKPNEGE